EEDVDPAGTVGGHDDVLAAITVEVAHRDVVRVAVGRHGHLPGQRAAAAVEQDADVVAVTVRDDDVALAVTVDVADRDAARPAADGIRDAAAALDHGDAAVVVRRSDGVQNAVAVEIAERDVEGVLDRGAGRGDTEAAGAVAAHGQDPLVKVSLGRLGVIVEVAVQVSVAGGAADGGGHLRAAAAVRPHLRPPEGAAAVAVVEENHAVVERARADARKRNAGGDDVGPAVAVRVPHPGLHGI